MNFLINFSISNIRFLMVLLVMLLMVLLFAESSLEGGCIRAIWNEWIITLYSGVQRWSDLCHEGMNLFIHSSLSEIWFFVMLVVMTVMRLRETRSVLRSKVLNLFVNVLSSNDCLIWVLMVLAVVLRLRKLHSVFIQFLFIGFFLMPLGEVAHIIL